VSLDKSEGFGGICGARPHVWGWLWLCTKSGCPALLAFFARGRGL